MILLNNTYLEYHDQAANSHKFHLLAVVEDQGCYRTLGLWGRVGSRGTFTIKYPNARHASGTAQLPASAVYQAEVRAKQRKGYQPMSPPPSLVARLTNLAASPPARSLAPVTASVFPAFSVIPPDRDAATNDRPLFALGQVLRSGWRAQVVWPLSGPVQLIRPPNDTIGVDEIVWREYLRHLRSIFGDVLAAASPIRDTIVEMYGTAAGMRVHDIARFDGHDVHAENLLRRLALLELVADELKAANRWPSTWEIAPAAPVAQIFPSPRGPIVVKEIEAPYDPAVTWGFLA